MISVIIPIYNVLLYVEKCVRSVMGQSYQDLEILLIDDGSTDGSGKVCDSLAEEDARIRVLHTENRGLSAARNLGCRESKGEYVYYLDGDDMITEDCMIVLLNALVESGADMCVGGCRKVNYKGKIIDKICAKSGIIVTSEEYLENFINRKPDYMVSSWNKLMKRTVAARVMFPEGIVYEDQATLARLLYVCKRIKLVNQTTYIYNQKRRGSITSTYNINNVEDYMISSEILANDIKNYFSDSSQARLFLENRELRNTQFAWSYMVMYLESIKGIESEEFKQKVLLLKNKYQEKIRLSGKINNIPDLRIRVFLHLIKRCPSIAERLYVFRNKWKNHGQ